MSKVRDYVIKGEYPKVHLVEPDRTIIHARNLFYDRKPAFLDWDLIKYPSLFKIYNILEGNYWVPAEISMAQDTNQWERLADVEGAQEAFKKTIGMIKCLDSNQSTFVYGLSRLASDLALENLLIKLAGMEVIHNVAYTVIEAAVLTSKERKENALDILDEELIEKANNLAFGLYEPFLNTLPNPSKMDLAKALIGNAILEGMRFTTAFAVVYGIHHSTGLMSGSTNQIQYINRDEAQHAYLFNYIFRIVCTEHEDEIDREELTKFAYDVMQQATENEIEWAEEILGDVDFIDIVAFEDYVKYIANKRMTQLGFEPIYEGLETAEDNPFPWIEAYEQPNLLKGDFFEETLLYSASNVNGEVDDY